MTHSFFKNRNTGDSICNTPYMLLSGRRLSSPIYIGNEYILIPTLSVMVGTVAMMAGCGFARHPQGM